MQLAQEEYKDFMLDLETLGTRPGDAIISIGGVLFDRETKSIGPGFRANLDIEQVIAAGFGVTGGTLKFWFEQSDEARKGALENPMNVHSVLMGLADFLTEGEGGVNKDIKVWGNGAAFDNVLLREMYQRLGLQEPWMFWNDRCFRTLKNECKYRKELEPEFAGERHNAFADAEHQAKWAINLYHEQLVFDKAEQMELNLNDTPQGEFVGGGEEQQSYVGLNEEESE